jgi:hypothetical protein
MLQVPAIENSNDQVPMKCLESDQLQCHSGQTDCENGCSSAIAKGIEHLPIRNFVIPLF